MTKPSILVTGSRKGIGKHLVHHFCASGWRVAGCSRAQPDFELDDYRHFCVDVTDESAVKKMFRGIRTQYGGLDALVNNAGVASMNHSLLTPMSVVSRVLQVNVEGTFLCCREAAKLMQRGNGGRIVNLTSIASALHLEGEAIYAASKSAVENMTRTLSRELAEFDITINAIGPTPVDTDLIRGIPENKLAQLLDRQAIPKMADVADVANVVDFFLKPESKLVTGQVIYLGGVF